METIGLQKKIKNRTYLIHPAFLKKIEINRYLQIQNASTETQKN